MDTVNCNCVLSMRNGYSIELGCCDKYLMLDELTSDKCTECGKTIVVFDTIEHAKERGK